MMRDSLVTNNEDQQFYCWMMGFVFDGEERRQRIR